MESVQALLVAQAADAIVGFLHGIHRQQRQILAVARLDYEDNQDFNSYIDESNEQVHIFDFIYRPSEVLFAVDQEAYRDLLADHEADDAEAEAASGRLE